ncbi:integrase catalytic domain-containing protein [Trichonephila clavata]|uniref:Integrase catalytic domain-containing protein n=1 Tax=Trichonephila clavata TaxID=2740835 RepID=A0A8X6HWJ1_TRICU|nr:integrase catalytic domain-containing protein [Trichonephila clavata]
MERENENLKREIESQKKKRTVVRQLTTKLLSKIETNLSADVADGEKKEILEDLKVQLEFKMSELRSLDEKIENHVPESEFENEITSSQEYQEKIVTVQGKIQRLLNRKLNSERRSEADNNEIKETVIAKSSENRTMNFPRLQIENSMHRSTDCKSKSNCVKCRGKHHESICFQRDLNSGKREEKEQNETISVSQNNSSRNESSVILQTVNALAIGREKKCFVKCLLDAGSQISAIREDLSRSLNLQVKGERELNIYTFGEKNCKRNKCKIVEVTLRNINNPEKKITLELMEVPIITTAEIRVPEEKIKQQLRRQGICLIEPSVEKCEPEIGILIGADVLWSITSSEIKRINKSCVAIETAFGWCLSGTFRNEERLTCGFMNVTSQLTVDLDKSVKSFWELESIGMNETNDLSSESEKALQIFESSIILKEKRYEISLSWKEENIKLKENFYVDDYICSVDSDDEARQVYHEKRN